MYCRNCSMSLPEGSTFCMGCGVVPLEHFTYCNHCGFKTKDSDSTCKSCGNKISYREIVVTAQESSDYCRNCGSTVDSHQEICLSCGVNKMSAYNYCNHCGNETQKYQYMCLACGNEVEHEAFSEFEVLTKYCRTCGNEVSQGSNMCRSCSSNYKDGVNYCFNCRAETNAKQELCLKCGIAFNERRVEKEKLKTFEGFSKSTASIEKVIRDATPYYSDEFKRIHESKGSYNGKFNIAAFLLGPIWAAARLNSGSFGVFNTVTGGLAGIVVLLSLVLVNPLPSFAYSLYLGFRGNKALLQSRLKRAFDEKNR